MISRGGVPEMRAGSTLKTSLVKPDTSLCCESICEGMSLPRKNPL